MFYSVFRDIKYCEYKRLSSGNFQLGTIVPCNEGLIDSLYEKYISKEKARGRLIQAYLFTMNRFSKEDEEIGSGKYRVKIYHMEDDEFRANLYPMSIVDFVRFKWFTRKHFRIL